MTPSSQPKLPTWIFIVTDLALIAAAGLIATNAHRPYSEATMFAIVACVIVGAVVACVPLVARYESQKNETLDDRQRALEALARTLTSSAEQISIATNGLNEIAELAQKNLRHAEKLPHQLQDKIAEFQAQLASANDAEKEELEKELVTLRAAESERLESISDKIAKATAELAKLETAAQKRLTSATESLAKSQTDAGALDTKFAATLTELDAKIAACSALVERALEAVVKAGSAPSASLPPAATTANEVMAEISAPPAAAAPEASVTDAPKAESSAHPPKRPRKPRREEAPADEVPVAVVSEPTAAPTLETPPPAEPTPIPETKSEEPPPVPTEALPEVPPVAPPSAEPVSSDVALTPTADAPVKPSPVIAEPVVTAPVATEPAPAEVEPAKPARKRASKKPEPEPVDAALSLDITETPAPESAEVSERVRSSDGATRLLVTAYIGIGNRLFVRGEGPGLSWEKGVPLQFVSIGKWRWETNDASAPVQFKLYKNDETECVALGTQALDPGQQQEVTASF